MRITKGWLEKKKYEQIVNIGKISIEYEQDSDNDDTNRNKHTQRLKLTAIPADSAIAYDKSEVYSFPYYIRIETLPFEDGKPGFWSIDGDDGFEELKKIIEDFKKRVSINPDDFDEESIIDYYENMRYDDDDDDIEGEDDKN